MSDLSATQYAFVVEMIKRDSGIALSDDKMYLVTSRLLPVARAEGFDSVAELVQAIQSGMSTAKDKVVDALTTNETSFFRDQKPFKALTNVVLPRILTNIQPNETLRIWSAACSSGQEPYSIALTLMEESIMEDMQFSITATDISEDMITRAKVGAFSQFEVQRGMPITMLMKYFTQREDRWIINDTIKQHITFMTHNLMKLPASGPFDLVFCRNVLIYFDADTKAQVLNRLAQTMKKEAMLFLGGTETIMGIDCPFQPVEDVPGLFSKL